MAVLGLGLAALGRPGYLTVGHGAALGTDRSVEALQKRCEQVCDAAWEGGIRWFDAARSYGRAEQFLAGWLGRRAIAPEQVTVSSKWGYTYTADWAVDADGTRSQGPLRHRTGSPMAGDRCAARTVAPALSGPLGHLGLWNSRRR